MLMCEAAGCQKALQSHGLWWPLIEVYTSWGHLRLQDSRLELEKLAAVLLDTGQTSRC